jgi:hypothetical protein
LKTRRKRKRNDLVDPEFPVSGFGNPQSGSPPHRPAAFSQRSSSRGASIRSAHFANAGVAPRQRNVSTFLKSGAIGAQPRARGSPRSFTAKKQYRNNRFLSIDSL